jgi:hypothetical protein
MRLIGALLLGSLVLVLFECVVDVVLRRIGLRFRVPFARSRIVIADGLAGEGISSTVSTIRNRWGERPSRSAIGLRAPRGNEKNVLFVGSSFVDCGVLETGADWPSVTMESLAARISENNSVPYASTLSASGLRSDAVSLLFRRHMQYRRTTPTMVVWSFGVTDATSWVTSLLSDHPWPAAFPTEEIFDVGVRRQRSAWQFGSTLSLF